MSASSTLPAGPRHAGDLDDRFVRARRWAVGTLLAGSFAVLGYLAAVLAAVWLVASAYDVVMGRSSPEVDLVGAVADLLPGLLVGWCTGLAAVSVLARGEALGPRAAGMAAGGLGIVAGAVVLRATGVF